MSRSAYPIVNVLLLWGVCVFVYVGVCVCVSECMYIDSRALKETEERRSANVTAQTLRPQKEGERAPPGSAKAQAQGQKKRVFSSVDRPWF
jgi:hypothetical protein